MSHPKTSLIITLLLIFQIIGVIQNHSLKKRLKNSDHKIKYLQARLDGHIDLLNKQIKADKEELQKAIATSKGEVKALKDEVLKRLERNEDVICQLKSYPIAVPPKLVEISKKLDYFESQIKSITEKSERKSLNEKKN